MNKLSLLAAAIFVAVGPFITSVHAEPPFAHVDSSVGGVTFDGKKLSARTEISREGFIQTDAQGSAQITLLPSHVRLILGHSTRFLLTRPENSGQQTQVLEDGAVRAKVVPNKDHGVFFRIKTRSSAVMGARGTDFLAITNSALDESELVVLDGNVEIYSEMDPGNQQIVSHEERSGLGGRFGHGPTAPVQLSKKALKYYESLTPDEVHHEEAAAPSPIPEKSGASAE